MVITDTIVTDPIGTHTERPQGLVEEPVVYAALAATEQALKRSQTAPTELLRRLELAQVRALLLTLPDSRFDLEGGLRNLIAVLRQPILDPRHRRSTPTTAAVNLTPYPPGSSTCR